MEEQMKAITCKACDLGDHIVSEFGDPQDLDSGGTLFGTQADTHQYTEKKITNLYVATSKATK